MGSIHSRLAAAVSLSTLVLFSVSACGVKQKTISVSSRVSLAKTLSRPEIFELFGRYCQQPDAFLIRNAAFTFSAESLQRKQREEIPTAPGLLIVTRDGRLRLRIEMPVIKTTYLDLVALQSQFKLWYPQRKTLYQGSLDTSREALEAIQTGESGQAPRYNLSKLRPWHITQIFFHQRFSPDSPVFLLQEDTLDERYYVLQESGISSGGEAIIRQKIWISRSALSIRRKTLYDETGAAVSDIEYTAYDAADPRVPKDILLRRPQEGYEVRIQVKTGEAGPTIRDAMFELTIPADASVKQIQ